MKVMTNLARVAGEGIVIELQALRVPSCIRSFCSGLDWNLWCW